MSQTITTTVSTQLTLATPLTITASGADTGADGVQPSIIDGSGPGTLVDDGFIGGGFFGVSLSNGGNLNIGAGGTIACLDAVKILGSYYSTLVNAGVINGYVNAIYISNGTIENQAGGRISGPVQLGSGNITNLGTLTGAVSMLNGGTLINGGTAAAITSDDGVGVDISGAPGLVQNQGMISSVYLNAGGAIANSDLIGNVAAAYGVATAGTVASTVTNSGTIIAVAMLAGGTLANGPRGVILGYEDGVKITAGGTVNNAGTILGNGGKIGEDFGIGGSVGVYIDGGGQISNTAGTALIGGADIGILIGTRGAATITNKGSITGGGGSGYGIKDTGAYNNTIVDYGLISGKYAVTFGTGYDVLVLKPGATLQGAVAGTDHNGEVEFANGTEAVTLTGLNSEFKDIAGFYNNDSSLVLSGPNTLAPSTSFYNTGIVLNSGSFDVFGTVTNYGTISGPIALGGLYIPVLAPDPTSAYVVNGAGGLIESSLATAIAPGEYAGVLPVTIVNEGTIADTAAGGTAVAFSAGLANVLEDDPGSAFIGLVDGGDPSGATAGSVLLLGDGDNTGTITSIGSSFTNFYEVSVAAGATWQVEDSTIANFVDSGTAILDSSNDFTGATIQLASGADLVLDQDLPAGAVVEFSGTNATLDVPHANILAFAAVAMAPSDTIDLSYVTYDPNGSVSVGPNNVIMLVENGTTHTINLSPSQDLTGEYFHIASDGFNGTDIIENSVPCFLAGTRIRTPAGDVPVEALNIGDLVTTAARTAKPIKWIGRRCYKAPLPPNPDIVPVCIAPGALADGLPDRDLFLSPLHALLIDDVLVPAGALVNGKSIRHCPELNQISYYHIETEAHDLVIANNAPAETFVDENSRNMFENAEEFYRLYPNAFHPTTVLAAPRLEFGAELERIRRKIALRAGVLLDQPRDGEVIGYLESADRRKITGWAYAPKQPNVPLCLDILNGGALLARTIANIPRPDVRQAGFGTGRYGFSVTLPAPLPALSRHEISIRPTGATRLLAGSPVVIDPGVASELLQTGGLQSLIDAAIRGAETPQQALQLGNTLEMAGKQIRVTTEADSGPAPARPAAAGRKVVLFLDEFWPTVTHDAGSNAVMSHIAAFQALGYQVVFCATSGAPRDGAAQAGCLALREHGVACHGQDGGAVETVLKDLARSGLDVVYLHRLGAAGAYAGMVKHIAPAAYVIYAIADIHALRLQRQAEVTDRPDLRLRAKSVEAAEFWAMQVVDCVLTHSRFEAAYLRHRVPHLNVKVVPWAVAPHPPGRLNARADIAFIGGAGHAPNVDAVAHLADSIMPLVWRELPEVRCLIAGAGWPAPRGGADDRMVYLGHQPDLAALLGRVKLTVAPLRFGAGIKGKVLESLAAGTPCVMSHIAAEGLPLTPLLQSVVGNGAELAANIRAVYRNKKTQRLLATAGIDLIADHFSEQAVVAALSDALRRQAAPLRPVQVAAA